MKVVAASVLGQDQGLPRHDALPPPSLRIVRPRRSKTDDGNEELFSICVIVTSGPAQSIVLRCEHKVDQRVDSIGAWNATRAE